MRSLLKILFLIIIVSVGIFFTLHNPEIVPIDFYYFRIEAPLSLVILFSLLLGVMLGWMLVWVKMLSRQRQFRQLKKKYAEAEAEITNLRKLPITDEPSI